MCLACRECPVAVLRHSGGDVYLRRVVFWIFQQRYNQVAVYVGFGEHVLLQCDVEAAEAYLEAWFASYAASQCRTIRGFTASRGPKSDPAGKSSRAYQHLLAVDSERLPLLLPEPLGGQCHFCPLDIDTDKTVVAAVGVGFGYVGVGADVEFGSLYVHPQSGAAYLRWGVEADAHLGIERDAAFAVEIQRPGFEHQYAVLDFVVERRKHFPRKYKPQRQVVESGTDMRYDETFDVVEDGHILHLYWQTVEVVEEIGIADVKVKSVDHFVSVGHETSIAADWRHNGFDHIVIGTVCRVWQHVGTCQRIFGIDAVDKPPDAVRSHASAEEVYGCRYVCGIGHRHEFSEQLEQCIRWEWKLLGREASYLSGYRMVVAERNWQAGHCACRIRTDGYTESTVEQIQTQSLYEQQLQVIFEVRFDGIGPSAVFLVIDVVKKALQSRLEKI